MAEIAALTVFLGVLSASGVALGFVAQTGVQTTDFVALAESFGIPAERTSPADLEGASILFTRKGPATFAARPGFGR
mgnify:CR=1 FL=1